MKVERFPMETDIHSKVSSCTRMGTTKAIPASLYLFGLAFHCGSLPHQMPLPRVLKYVILSQYHIFKAPMIAVFPACYLS